jgi:hypothetical protein
MTSMEKTQTKCPFNSAWHCGAHCELFSAEARCVLYTIANLLKEILKKTNSAKLHIEDVYMNTKNKRRV